MSSEENVGSILFVPVCSKCLNIIEDEVGLQEDIDIISNRFAMKKDIVEPYCCSKCGAIFESIDVPIDFPFKFETIRMNWMN